MTTVLPENSLLASLLCVVQVPTEPKTKKNKQLSRELVHVCEQLCSISIVRKTWLSLESQTFSCEESGDGNHKTTRNCQSGSSHFHCLFLMNMECPLFLQSKQGN